MVQNKQKEIMGRDSILKAIKQHKPDLLPIPEIDGARFDDDVNLLDIFKHNVALVGGSIKEVDKALIDIEIKKQFPHAENIVALNETSTLGTISVNKQTDPHELATIDLAIVNGAFGVAENGAVWVSEKESIVRVLPFISNDLVIILLKEQLVLHMLQAYHKIATRDRNFGVFISGPSKTADIEQCLVIGAQGAMSLTILLV
ncbi:LUD domain-containing protein [Aureibaculum sp. A20]|uniref:LUD domain-containing protein n=1 Tax=Aureibaculum flavum TaxID=2795986 RepID=A0ABS0WV96_9FLAO|nr:LUD domain-containing protein [Aureibaculum flavum]MBJ2175921.1 LUD domain-containing protein [Aureibaculum flavum]